MILQQKNRILGLILASTVTFDKIIILLLKQAAAIAIFLDPKGKECIPRHMQINHQDTRRALLFLL